MFTFTKTATSDLRQADRATSGSLEINLRLDGVVHMDLDTTSP